MLQEEDTVKRIITLALALTVGLAFAGSAHAQTGTKVAVVNVGEVFQKYDKAKAYKAELEKIIGPRKAEAETLSKQMKDWAASLQHPSFDKKEQSRYEQAILANKRKLEDMDRQVRTEIGKVQESQIVNLYKDLNAAVEATAKAQGFQLVLAYGDISGDQFTLENINRKMNGMDLGSTTPLFFAGSANITDQVTASLNALFRSTGGAAATVPATPTSAPR